MGGRPGSSRSADASGGLLQRPTSLASQPPASRWGRPRSTSRPWKARRSPGHAARPAASRFKHLKSRNLLQSQEADQSSSTWLIGSDREIAFVNHGRQMDGFRGQGRDTPPLFPFFASCRRHCGALFHSQLHDPFDQVIGDRLIQGKLEIALRSSVACNSFFKRLVARNRWI
jgi:hypothetical protein